MWIRMSILNSACVVFLACVAHLEFSSAISAYSAVNE